ncbi:hypothetical protein Tco_1352338 [Tanacetum coccineum]
MTSQTTAISISTPNLRRRSIVMWAMEIEHYLCTLDNEVWKVIQNGNSKKRISTRKDGIVRVLSPVTAAEIQAVEKERKAKNILLMAIPKEHMRRFHGMDDAKEIWEAIRTRFGEGLEWGYDRFQQLLSQLEAHSAEVSTEDANHKFLRSLPAAWECTAKGTHDGKKKRDSLYQHQEVGKQEKNQMGLLTMDDGANEIYEKDEKLKRYRRIGMKAVKEKEQLQKIVDSWKDSSKNLWRLIDSGMSSNSEVGLGFEIQSNNEVLSYEEEMHFSVFNCSKEDSNGKPLYSRFTKTNDFKGVPHLLSGDYTPKPQVGKLMILLKGFVKILCATLLRSESESLSVNEMSKSRLEVLIGKKNKHNQVGFLRKPDESAGFAEIVDFLRGSNLRYALTTNPTIYDSLVKQFWQTATTNTKADGTLEINATIDTIGYSITEASIRNTLQLGDATGITMLPNDEIFEGMGQMGYPTDGTFTFWKSFFTPQWRYLVHHLLHCISSKSGGWDQFGSNIATALICLSTARVYNFSKLIFDGMVANLKSKTKFLMYPRFLQMILNIQTENKHLYLAVSLTKKIFGNMKRGFRGAPRPLLPAMLLVATNPNAGQEHDVVAQSQPSSSTPPVPSTSSLSTISTPTTHPYATTYKLFLN